MALIGPLSCYRFTRIIFVRDRKLVIGKPIDPSGYPSGRRMNLRPDTHDEICTCMKVMRRPAIFHRAWLRQCRRCREDVWTLPRIAIPNLRDDQAYNQRSLPQYIHAVTASGGTAVPIPLHATAVEWARILASCSGILLPESPADVDPGRYGQERARKPQPEMRPGAVDELLCRGALDQGKPVLGFAMACSR